MTTTTTHTETTLLQLVVKYCQLEKQAQSKYFPLTEKAIEMFEYGLDKKQVSKQFRLAFAEANAMEAKEFTKHIEYNQFSKLVSPFIRIASRGRTWYEEHKRKKTGFHRMVRLTQSKPKPNPTTE